MKNAFLEIITAAFSAGGVKVYAMAGEYFEIIDSAYPVTVRLVDKYGAQRGIMRDAETSFFIKAGDFNTIEVTSASAQTIRFAFGTSEAGTRRTAGVVSVVDSSKSRTIAGAAFIAAFNVPGVAAVVSSGVLWNPAGSGKNIFVQRLRLSLSAASSYGCRHVTSLGAGLTLRPEARVPKKLGTVPAFEAYETTASNFSGAVPAINSIFTASLAANAVDVGDLYEPVMVAPGNGIEIFASVPATALKAALELIEEAI